MLTNYVIAVDDALQGRRERRGQRQHLHRVWHRPVHPGVRAGARPALEERGRLDEGVVSRSSTSTGSRRPRSTCAATPTSTCRSRTPSRCSRRFGAAACRPSSSSIRASTTASGARASCATGSSATSRGTGNTRPRRPPRPPHTDFVREDESHASMIFGIGFLLAAALGAVPGGQPFSLDDLARLRGVRGSRGLARRQRGWRTRCARPISKEDKHETHIWMTSWDGKETVRLTTGKESETNAALEPRRAVPGVPVGPRRRQRRRRSSGSSRARGARRRSSPSRRAASRTSTGLRTASAWCSSSAIPTRMRPPTRTDGEEGEDEEADRHRPLPVQARRLRLPRRAAQAPLPPRSRQPQGRAADDRELRRAAPVVVARRQDDRLRLQAGPGPGPHRQLGRVRDRAARGRRRRAS